MKVHHISNKRRVHPADSCFYPAVKKLEVYSNFNITFLQPPEATKKDLETQAHVIFLQALFMLQNDLTLDCHYGYRKRTQQVRPSLILDPQIINRDSQEIDKRGRLGSI